MKIKLTNNEPFQLDSITNDVAKSVDLARDLLTTSDISEWAKQSTKPAYNGSEINYTGTTGNVVTNNTTLNAAVQALDTAVNNRLKYVLLSQAEYDSLTDKDSGTLYLIEGVKYSVSLSVTGTAYQPSITINNVVYQQSEFPIQVNDGDTLSIKCYGSMNSITITMGGSTVATGYADTTFTVSNVSDDIVITAYDDAPA